eukprot:TRINITY_DN3248_c1_g1_i1.p1 TRINITY_DN3248_c1_g1~~TRINITY_DN3248_c1_g1_i1.p1  ORF type:complete len:712 (-),score=161.13 TRINITY_DN3248_c1_g1_i1:131-2266(-)
MTDINPSRQWLAIEDQLKNSLENRIIPNNFNHFIFVTRLQLSISPSNELINRLLTIVDDSVEQQIVNLPLNNIESFNDLAIFAKHLKRFFSIAFSSLNSFFIKESNDSFSNLISFSFTKNLKNSKSLLNSFFNEILADINNFRQLNGLEPNSIICLHNFDNFGLFADFFESYDIHLIDYYSKTFDINSVMTGNEFLEFLRNVKSCIDREVLLAEYFPPTFDANQMIIQSKSYVERIVFENIVMRNLENIMPSFDNLLHDIVNLKDSDTSKITDCIWFIEMYVNHTQEIQGIVNRMTNFIKEGAKAAFSTLSNVPGMPFNVSFTDKSHVSKLLSLAFSDKQITTLIDSLLKLDLRDILQRHGFSDGEILRDLSEVFEVALNSEEVIIAILLAKKYHQLLSMNRTNESIKDGLEMCHKVFCMIRANEIFKTQYISLLSLRLLGPSCNLGMEKSIISRFGESCGMKYSEKMFKMILDVNSSRELVNAFGKKNLTVEIRKFRPTIISPSLWMLTNAKLKPNIPSFLENARKSFEIFHKSLKPEKNIEWLFGYGQAIVKFAGRTLQVTEPQMLVLHQFSVLNSPTKQIIADSCQLPIQLVASTLDSLVKFKILTENDGVFTVSDYKEERINLLNVSDQVMDTQITSMIKVSRDAVECRIVQLLKQHGMHEQEELFEKVCEELKMHVPKDFFIERLKHLQSGEFIFESKGYWNYRRE